MNEKRIPTLTYARPISLAESKGDERKLYITGNAISAGISRNNVEYSPDVLKAAARTLIGKPLMLNHGDNDVNNIIGKIVEAGYDGRNVPFKAELDQSETKIINKLKNGYINKVSIGADTVDENGNHYDVEPDDDGIIRPKGIEFLELSLVPIPGVPNASINQVIAESYKVKKMSEEKKMDEQLEELKKENEALRKKLAEQEEAEDDSSTEETSEEPEEPTKNEPTEPKNTEESSKVKALEEKIEKLTETVSKITDRPKGVASETSEKKEVPIKVEMIHNPKRGVDIFNASAITERAKPGSGRRWELY